VLLDAWITRSMEQYQRTCADDLVRAVEDLAPVLSIALHELVRQVMHHCTERGVVLKKIWETYVQLFNRVLKQMQTSLYDHRRRTGEVSSVLGSARDELEQVRRNHPDHMQKVISDLEAQFTKRQHEVEAELNEHEAENTRLKTDLRNHHGELEMWYPSFQLYQDSYIKGHIPQYMGPDGPKRRTKRTTTLRKTQSASHDTDDAKDDEDEDIPPEVAIAEDFKRLLAVLSPEKRRLIGKELAEVLMPALLSSEAVSKAPRKSNKKGTEKVLSDAESAANTALKTDVASQEERIRGLRDRIARLERIKEEQASHVPTSPKTTVRTTRFSDGDALGV